MKKIIFALLVALSPAFVYAVPQVDQDLHVKISDDITVDSGEEFALGVLEAYDDLERCENFYYDWRQSSGPLGVSPLNTEVLNPKFQIFTPGEYVFALSIKETCEDVEIISEPDQVMITVLDPISDPTAGTWNLALAPSDTTIPADGITSHAFNFFIKHSYDGQTDYPNDEKIEVLLKSENELLKNNLGKYTLKSSLTKNGKIGIVYTPPLIDDSGFAGGDITMQIATVHGTTTSVLHITPRKEIAKTNLTITQITDNPAYLVKGKPALGRVTLNWAGTTESLTGEVRIFINNEEVFDKTDTFYSSYTTEQILEKENSVDFYFTPKTDEITIGAYFQNDDGSTKAEKIYTVKTVKPFLPQIFALRQGEYADLDVVDLSTDQNLIDKISFAYSRLPISDFEIDTTHIQTKNLEDVDSADVIILPSSATTNDLANAFYLTDDVNILARKIYTRSDLPSSQGVLLTDTDFEIIFAESPTIFTDNGKGVNQKSTTDFAKKLVLNPEFIDLSASHWAYGYISDLLAKNIVRGYVDNTFRPDQAVTRAEFLKMLLVAKGKNPSSAQGNTTFVDVDITQWYAPYVELAFSKNIVSGYGDNTFRPAQGITRAEAVKIITAEQNYEMPVELNTTPFPDINITDWYAPCISVAVEEKLINGYADGYFRPNKAITRAESAKIIDLLTK